MHFTCTPALPALSQWTACAAPCRLPPIRPVILSLWDGASGLPVRVYHMPEAFAEAVVVSVAAVIARVCVA